MKREQILIRIIVTLSVLVIFLILHFYIPTVIKNDNILIIFAIIRELCKIYIITEIINFLHLRNMENDKKVFFNEIRENYIKKEIAAGILNLNDEPKLVDLLYTELYKNSILRKDLNIHISFKEDNGKIKEDNGKIKEKQIWNYKLHNRSNVMEKYEHKYSSVDRDALVRMTSFSYYYADDENNKFYAPIPKNDTKKVYNRHSVFIKIPPNSSVTVTAEFDINLPYCQNFYMNDIGILMTTINCTIHIDKPAGYLFSIENYGTNNILSIDDVTKDFNSADKTSLDYAFPVALFAGTGIEYILEKNTGSKNKR
jgi:hypothetical protein